MWFSDFLLEYTITPELQTTKSESTKLDTQKNIKMQKITFEELPSFEKQESFIFFDKYRKTLGYLKWTRRFHVIHQECDDFHRIIKMDEVYFSDVNQPLQYRKIEPIYVSHISNIK